MIAILLQLLIASFLAYLFIQAARFLPPAEEKPEENRETADEGDSTRRLSTLLQCPTVSFPDPEMEDQGAFRQLEEILPQLFPHVHAQCAFEKVGTKGLMFHLTGSSPALDKEPLVLTAHYDVVPAEGGGWVHPPFSGLVQEGVIYGRGALDTKCTFSAILSAVDTLLADGYAPERDLYLCFAGDEEVMGHGAADIAALLKERGIAPLMVLDEGGAIVENAFPGIHQPFAVVGIGEKGSANYRITVTGKGGHSSAPLSRSALDQLFQAGQFIKKHPFPYRMTFAAKAMFDTLGRHTGFLYRLLFANLNVFGPLLDAATRKMGGEFNALVRTTAVPTTLSAGKAYNVIPQEASMTVNCRILPGETTETVRETLLRHADPKKLGNVTVQLIDGSDPSAVSTLEDGPWQTLSRTIRATFPGVLVTPYLMLAMSDARQYTSICPRVYRFSPMMLSRDERHMIHGENEQIPAKKQLDAQRFFQRLIREICGDHLIS